MQISAIALGFRQSAVLVTSGLNSFYGKDWSLRQILPINLGWLLGRDM